jgi:septum formation inhibitor MinC
MNKKNLTMSIHSSKYDSGKIAMLKQLLENNARNGRPTEYEIKVDELKAVPRTNDPAQFDSYEDFFSPDTRTIIITLFEGQGKSSDKHIFTMGSEQLKQAEPAPSLSGLDIDKKVDEKVETLKKQMEYDKVVEENKELKEQVKDAEEFIEKLEKALELEKQGRLKIKGVHVGEIASIAAESLIRRNPHWIAKVPGMEGLAGFIEEDTQKKGQETSGEESEVTFSKKNPIEELSEEEKNLLGALGELQEVFEEDELSDMGDLIRLLMKKKQALSPALAFVQNWKEQKEVPQKEKIEAVKKPATQENKTENAEIKPADDDAKQVNTEEIKSIHDISDADEGNKSISDADAELEEGIPETA